MGEKIRSITIKEVSREAGVSINTVSRALNSRPDISTATKKKVLEIAKRLDYRPNKLAKGLRSKKTKTVGVVVTDISNPFFASLIKAVKNTAKESGYSVILQDTDEDYEKEKEAIQIMLAERVDGLLITPVQIKKKTIQKLKETGFPFVLLGRHFDHLRTAYVTTDDIQGGFIATEHLIKQGHRKITLINGPCYISSAKERFKGYQKALNHYGIEMDQSLVSHGAVTMKDGYRIGKSLMSQRQQFTAIFAYSDIVALGIIKAIHNAGLRVAEDIAVVGYDDIEFSFYLETALTTVKIPKRTLGKKAMELLSSMMVDKGQSRVRSEIKLPVKLVVRQSSCSINER